jgi:hypothetical protein
VQIFGWREHRHTPYSNNSTYLPNNVFSYVLLPHNTTHSIRYTAAHKFPHYLLSGTGNPNPVRGPSPPQSTGHERVRPGHPPPPTTHSRTHIHTDVCVWFVSLDFGGGIKDNQYSSSIINYTNGPSRGFPEQWRSCCQTCHQYESGRVHLFCLTLWLLCKCPHSLRYYRNYLFLGVPKIHNRFHIISPLDIIMCHLNLIPTIPSQCFIWIHFNIILSLSFPVFRCCMHNWHFPPLPSPPH